jgi:DNA-binding protein
MASIRGCHECTDFADAAIRGRPNEIGRAVETVQVIREELDSILKDNL